MPRVAAAVLLGAACCAAPSATATAAASMPQCDVSTEHSSSPRFERVANGHTVTLQTYEGTSSSTQCANLCLQTPSCSSFVLDVLSPSPSCSLHALATHTHAESNNVTGGSSSSLSSSSSNRWGSLREQVAVAVGVCREKEAYSLPEDDMPVLLGLDYFEKGVDIVNDTINRTKNIRLPVYTFHFEEGKNYFDPFSLVSYKVPDEVSMTVDEAGYEQIDSLYTDSYSSSVTETTKRYSYSVGIQMDFGNVGAGVTYADNKQWYNFNLEEHERMNYNSHSVMWWKFWDIQAYPFDVLGTNSLDPMLKSFLDQLPPTIKSPADNTQYQRLIDNWGTSYVTWSNFGGGLNLDIFTNGSFDRSQSQEWKSDQHSLAFHFHLYDIDPSASIAGFTNKSQIHVNQSFVNESRVELYYEGGDPTLMGEDSLVPWKQSIRKAPHWLNVTYQKLSKLPYLADSHPQTAATLDTFIMEYLKNAMRNSSAH
eukprot:INCI11702.1.p2 GENE.INCI11702.1~~INCI11702.1.p2  ORF type:complete len:539 (-),score=92.83 INCI11702.1:2673-4112(-)